MATQNNALYATCPYLQYDPALARNALSGYGSGGFRVLARLVSLTKPTEGEVRRRGSADTPRSVSATFEVVGADWATGWLNLSDKDWIRDIKGKAIESRFSLGNAPLGRFTYEPSDKPWDMMLLSASLGDGLSTPDDALRRWQQGAMPQWFQASVYFGYVKASVFCPVKFFSSIFDDGQFASVCAIRALSKKSLAKAGRRFRMPKILKQSGLQFGARLTERSLVAEHLTVYDVGQGVSQALVRLDDTHVTPELFVDMGCGRNHSQDTTLQNLRFCTSASPQVILSHADEDHWCGAITKAMATAGYPAHVLAWTAPATTASASFMAFARSVWSQGGSVRTLDLTGFPPRTITAKTKTGSLLIAQGTSVKFNDSGLIVAVVHHETQHYWLLPGDCDYHFFPAPLKFMATESRCVALTAFHHGAKPMQPTAIPHAVVGDYRRLVYSFGCGNGYGHPTPLAATGHNAAGWPHDATWLAAPGVVLPSTSSHARATAWTPAAPPPYLHGGGVLIGWAMSPVLPPTAACCANGCAAAVPVQV